MANLLGGVWRFQHCGVFLGHSSLVVPSLFLSQGMMKLNVFRHILCKLNCVRRLAFRKKYAKHKPVRTG